jgi:uncharacterized protein YkwD
MVTALVACGGEVGPAGGLPGGTHSGPTTSVTAGTLSSTSSTTTTGAGGAGGGTGTTDDLQFCLDENNRYRATVGSPPLVRTAELDAFAAAGAQYDYDAMSAHKHFGDSHGAPGGNASGENEIPGWGGWSIESQKSVRGVLEGGLKAMWDEGPGGGHYENMKNPKYTKFGCGIYVAPNAEQDVTVTMDFTN